MRTKSKHGGFINKLFTMFIFLAFLCLIDDFDFKKAVEKIWVKEEKVDELVMIVILIKA